MNSGVVKRPLWIAHIGILLVAIPVPLLLFPSKTPVGGVPGLASLLFFLTAWSPGAIMLALNLCTLGLAMVTVGMAHSGRSLYASIILAGVVEGLYRLFPLPVVTSGAWPWIMQAIAAVVMGVGLAMAVIEGYPPAGTAILSVILTRYTHIRTVIWLALMDISIATATAILMNLNTGIRTLVGIVLMYSAYALTERYMKKYL